MVCTHRNVNHIRKWSLVNDTADILTYLPRYDHHGNLIEAAEFELLITLNEAVCKKKGCISVASAQKAGKKRPVA